jgi:RNA polymerase sigma-70 factor (ECF subfamily)
MGEGKPIHNAEADDLLAISEVLRGTANAFRSLVERYRGLVFRLALSALGNREEAEEASQEIFLKAFRSLGSFRIEKRFLPWLYSIAANHLKTRAVRVRRAESRLVRDAHERFPARAEDDPQSQAERAQSQAEVTHAVAALPLPLREVVRLYYFEGMSVEQAGSVLGLGSENVKSRLLRGRRMLKELLEQNATDAGPPGYTHGGNGMRSSAHE